MTVHTHSRVKQEGEKRLIIFMWRESPLYRATPLLLLWERKKGPTSHLMLAGRCFHGASFRKFGVYPGVRRGT